MKKTLAIGFVVLAFAVMALAPGTHAASSTTITNGGNAWSDSLSSLQAWINDLTRQLAALEAIFNERFGHTALAPSPAPASVQPLASVSASTTVSVKFSIGDKIQTTAKVSVRKSALASSKSLGKQNSGALGTIVGGPSFDSVGGYWFWQVNYNSGADGWTAEDWLQKVPIVVTPPPPTPTPTPTPAPTPTPTPAPTPTPTPTPAPTSTQGAAGEARIIAYTTAYGWPDNTPPGAATISNPILHQVAGGTGTYADPITIAVGHSIIGNTDILDYPAGTRFYIPNLRRYFIVEDTCGDGNTPQNGPCHSLTQAPQGVAAWVDMWVGGNGTNNSAVLACEDTVTGAHLIVKNPASNYAVISGPVFNASCAQQYGDTLVAN